MRNPAQESSSIAFSIIPCAMKSCTSSVRYLATLLVALHATAVWAEIQRMCAFTPVKSFNAPLTCCQAMKRPILDQVASALFNLERKRVESSSVMDVKGRVGEPMEWSESGSLTNTFSEVMAGGVGYKFKQFVADIVAGDFDEEKTKSKIEQFVKSNRVAMFSFSTCPFCRRAKDYFEEGGIDYAVMELDELAGNEGNEIRAVLGRKIKRTSVPCIFINGKCIGGCNDGPGLLPLARSGELERLLGNASH